MGQPGGKLPPSSVCHYLHVKAPSCSGAPAVAGFAPSATHLAIGTAAAVVTDVGSAAAHASIIAREYGIPAVVGCGDATARLRTGMRVTVDGNTGNVEPA